MSARKLKTPPARLVGMSISYTVLGIMALVAVFPALFTLITSLMGEGEIISSYYNAERPMDFHLIPRAVSLEGYLNTFLFTPNYLVKFWSSMALTLAIVAGQVVLSCLGAYGFAKFRFPLKGPIFYLLIILMMMPLQVTLVSNFILLDALGLIGTYAAVILPGIFSPFGVFLLTQVFSSIPDELIEAGKIDGAGHLRILRSIVLPYGKTGIAALAMLSFIDNWNMVEQPLVFLRSSTMYPFSVFLSRIDQMEPGKVFVCAVLAMVPVVILFIYLKDALVRGIEYSNMK